ncbi:MAG: hypothetical protein IPK29_14050 [Betaproteobacteria bacterium]|nr:hypothetical protein [Betaproteobacteria bacterium]
MKLPVIGFAGMTHLGLVSGVSASEKGFSLVCFDPDAKRIERCAKCAGCRFPSHGSTSWSRRMPRG